MTANVPGTGKGNKPSSGIGTGIGAGEFPEPPNGIEQQSAGEGGSEQAQDDPDTWGNTGTRPVLPDTWGNTILPSQ
ncbi:hypothetical protein ACFOSC_27275 [Streptantibioticus rubrisoli]|uniref:Uncharacterized protein n=1 Tax=Streptantibioticus rubrisoli TaxID=1387313 RepID=A0ABT1PAD3_9ACTN|nr:hypothetical protein [Streptantibioticus rubrisoli]MCQ4042332.1 hypothetical protein [Streptantibioticus rubrisoli]